MNRAHFVFQSRNIDLRKLISPPRNITEVRNWIKAARKSIPQIPDLATRTDWRIFQEVVTTAHIMVELQSSIGERAFLVIERKNAMDP